MTENKTNKNSWLNYMNLSDTYERKARFLPGILSLLFLLPNSTLFGNFIEHWIKVIVGGVGIGGILAVGISHLSSAAGNRFQKKLWPNWPYDSPTNRWLQPNDDSRSKQQKEIWYKSIKRLTNLDIKATILSSNEEIKSIINDSVSIIRYQLRNTKYADRLCIHNIDYGFARNFTGLRSLWLTFALVSCSSNWIDFYIFNGEIWWCISTTALVIFSFILAFKILPTYVQQKAKHYAESFFGAMVEMDKDKSSKK